MKKINVNTGVCIGCGACVAIDSEHFDFNDDGYSEVINNDNIDSAELSNAISSCPVNAISISEDDNCNCNHCECGNNCDCNK